MDPLVPVSMLVLPVGEFRVLVSLRSAEVPLLTPNSSFRTPPTRSGAYGS